MPSLVDMRLSRAAVNEVNYMEPSPHSLLELVHVCVCIYPATGIIPPVGYM